MSENKIAPPEVKEYYDIFVEKWLEEGWESCLKYVNDEFHDGWLIDVYLPGSQREPMLTNIPANGTVPHFMIRACIFSFQKGNEYGHIRATDGFIVAAAVKAANDAVALARHSPMYIRASKDVSRLCDSRSVEKALSLLKEEEKNDERY